MTYRTQAWAPQLEGQTPTPSLTCLWVHTHQLLKRYAHGPTRTFTEAHTEKYGTPTNTNYQCEHMPTRRPDTRANNTLSHTLDTLIEAH